MTEHERALLLFVAERLVDTMRSYAPEPPEYGWDGCDPGPQWNEITDLYQLIAAVEKEKAQ